MNILVTGASGFIGTNLIEKMKEIGLDDQLLLLTDREILGFHCISHNNYSFTFKDFLDKGIQYIDTVIHLGAFIPKSSSDANDVHNCNLNIYNTEHLIHNLPTLPSKFIYISTVDVYTNDNSIISESTPTIPSTLYGFSKLYCEEILREWAKKNNIILQILRIGHTYGKGEDNYRKIIPESMKKIINNEEPVIYGEGLEKRSFIHVKDVCRLIIHSTNFNEEKGPINIASGVSIKIKDLVNLMIQISGKELAPKIVTGVGTGRNRVFNNSKMITLLGNERICLQDGLIEEYNYFLNKVQ